MHPTRLPSEIVERLRERRGRLHLFDALDARRTALAVIDMQESFVAEGAPSTVAAAREIVPNINRLAGAMRSRGGAVAWVQATYTREGPGYWPLFFDHIVAPQLSAAILEGLTEGRPGHALWRELDVQPGDLRVRKNRYSAFFPGACPLPELLCERGVDTVLITGTMTNVCCEASARDAMMAGFKTVMVADANAARSDAEHVAALATLAQFFADVRSSDEVLEMLS
ncbi:MAG TPA: isochorismatase family cysteine hydrolase [Burkholderiales bacterium]|jgi:ureidoacrylate peracid hydrolase